MTETPAEKAEAAAIRRRWITLGELVAVAGLIISALAFWNSFVDRRADEADRRAERLTETRQRRAVLLVASPSSSGRELDLRDTLHPIQNVTVSYPRSLGMAPTSSAGRLTIAANWFSGPLLALTDAGADAQTGKLPVLIKADYWDGDNHVTDQAIYDVLWRTEGRVLRGRAVRLDGLVLRQRNHATQAQIDALWKRLAPKPQR